MIVQAAGIWLTVTVSTYPAWITGAVLQGAETAHGVPDPAGGDHRPHPPDVSGDEPRCLSLRGAIRAMRRARAFRIVADLMGSACDSSGRRLHAAVGARRGLRHGRGESSPGSGGFMTGGWRGGSWRCGSGARLSQTSLALDVASSIPAKKRLSQHRHREQPEQRRDGVREDSAVPREEARPG